VTAQPTKTVVLGLGNILHSDDGVGPRAVEMLRGDERVPGNVALVDGGTLGLELLTHVGDCSRLLVLDSVDVGQHAGTLVRISGDESANLAGAGSVHQLGVADLLAALRVMVDRCPEIVLLGLQPGTTEWGTSFSAPVQAALHDLVEAAVEELHSKAHAIRATNEPIQLDRFN
jgi:hydrogenase maturation protease